MNLDPYKTYTSPKGRTYRVTGLEKLEETGRFFKDKWEYRWHWMLTIKFLDQKEEFLHLIYDHSDTLIGKLSHEEKQKKDEKDLQR